MSKFLQKSAKKEAQSMWGKRTGAGQLCTATPKRAVHCPGQWVTRPTSTQSSLLRDPLQQHRQSALLLQHQNLSRMDRLTKSLQLGVACAPCGSMQHAMITQAIRARAQTRSWPAIVGTIMWEIWAVKIVRKNACSNGWEWCFHQESGPLFKANFATLFYGGWSSNCLVRPLKTWLGLSASKIV